MGGNVETILLSGVPRSGTTLCCYLLNRFNNTIALHEPIDPDQFSSDKSSAVEVIRSFARDVRSQALNVGSVPSKQRGGEIPDNPVSTYDDRRAESVVVDNVTLTKPLTNNFLLVIKHNALFTALCEELRSDFRFYALVRNPLPVLASWRSVDLPVGKGRLPMGEQFCSSLSRSLLAEGDLLKRQLIILRWFFDKYRKLEAGNILSYEDLVSSNAEVLKRISPYTLNQSIEVQPQLKNSRLSEGEIKRLALELQGHPDIYEGFYSADDIEKVLREMVL